MNYIHDYSIETLKILESAIKANPAIKLIDSDNEIYYRNLLLDKLVELGFIGFLHTTEYKNFINIMNEGTLNSRHHNIQNNIDFIDDADQEVIIHTESDIQNYVRFYYFPKTPTNFRANYEHPVILVFDRRIIFDKTATFLSMGGGNIDKIRTKKAEKALEFKWKLIAERGNYLNSAIYSDENSKQLITKYRNAEFLFYDKISTAYVEKVIFKYKNDYMNACQLNHTGIEFVLDSSLFN